MQVKAVPTQQRNLIALPSIEDLRRQSERTGKEMSPAVERQYQSAQWKIKQAQRQMAKAALAIVNPDEFGKIERERKDRVQQANREAADRAAAFFTETCTGFVE